MSVGRVKFYNTSRLSNHGKRVKYFNKSFDTKSRMAFKEETLEGVRQKSARVPGTLHEKAMHDHDHRRGCVSKRKCGKSIKRDCSDPVEEFVVQLSTDFVGDVFRKHGTRKEKCERFNANPDPSV